MKRIPLHTFTDEDTGGAMVWAEIVRQVVRRPLDPQRGADVDELRRGIRILDALDQSGSVLELEDADWEHLRDKTLAMPWGVIDRRVLQFVDDVLGATEQLPLNYQNGVAVS
jgi:hypothetical protein